MLKTYQELTSKACLVILQLPQRNQNNSLCLDSTPHLVNQLKEREDDRTQTQKKNSSALGQEPRRSIQETTHNCEKKDLIRNILSNKL